MKFLDWMTDTVALIATVLIGMATTAYLFASITSELWSQVIMGCLGGGLPLLSVRFLMKKKMPFFWLTVCLIVFSDTSMILSLTEGQAKQVEQSVAKEATTDPALARLQAQTDRAQTTLDELLAQQREAHTAAFLANLKTQIDQARTDLESARGRESTWKPEQVANHQVSSRDVFMAVVRMAVSGDISRYLTFLLSLLVAIVYQGTVIATVSATVKNVRKSEKAESLPKKRTRKKRVVKEKEPTPEPLPTTPVPSDPLDW